MAATASITSTWIPEDDVLLKNAVEAGASLEALAKGAVQFSRRFTFKELQDRWRSLLYDPNVSAQASADIFQLELSSSFPSSKFNKLDNLKGSKDVHEKRKFGSIRRQYYSMRKKIQRELYNSSDIDFLAEPNLHNFGEHRGDIDQHVAINSEPQDGNFMLGDFMSDHFELHETDFDILHQEFPETMRDIDAAIDNTSNAFHSQCPGDNGASRTVRKDGFCAFPEGDFPSIGNSGRDSFEQNIGSGDIDCPAIDNPTNVEKCLGGKEIDPPKKLPYSKPSEPENSGMKNISTLDTRDDYDQNLCPSLRGKQKFISPDLDGTSTSCQTIGFSSLLPRQCKTLDDMSPHPMPVNLNHQDTIQGTKETSLLHDGGVCMKASASVHDVSHSESQVQDRHNNVGVTKSTAIPYGEFADTPDSLLNFPHEDSLLFMNVDGKEAVDESCSDNVHSKLVSSPNDRYCKYNLDAVLLGSCSDVPVPHNVPKVEPEALEISNTCFTTNVAEPAESEIIASSTHCTQQNVCLGETKVSSTSVLSPNSFEVNHGYMFCTLNTEDTEIPCNDDIFLLIHPVTSGVDSITVDVVDPKSTPACQKGEQRVNLGKEKEDTVRSAALLDVVGPKMLPETTSRKLSISLEKDLPDAKYQPLVLKNAKKSLHDRSQCLSLSADGMMEESVAKVQLRVGETPSTCQENLLRGESSFLKVSLPELGTKPTISDQEESENDDDVPYFSDIETMILEMDLGPLDQDSFISRQVSSYQQEDFKRRIIRLEQCARSSMQRAMSSQGALAILYGRHSKHYIRKTEGIEPQVHRTSSFNNFLCHLIFKFFHVSRARVCVWSINLIVCLDDDVGYFPVMLGRSTEEVDVDIDLGKEGRANKISRRQAIIKMQSDGSFLLKNLGKSSISVNGKAVATGQLLTLITSCVVEIKGMNFVFEINRKYVKQYLDSVARINQEKCTNFTWLPDGQQ